MRTSHLPVAFANDLAFSPDARILAIGAGLLGKGQICLLNLEKPEVEMPPVVLVEGGGIVSVAFNLQNDRLSLLTGSTYSRKVKTWDVNQGDLSIRQSGQIDGPPLDGTVSISPTGWMALPEASGKTVIIKNIADVLRNGPR